METIGDNRGQGTIGEVEMERNNNDSCIATKGVRRSKVEVTSEQRSEVSPKTSELDLNGLDVKYGI